MSLMISVSCDELLQLFGGVGLTCRFTDQERLALSTTPVVETPQRVFAYPVPADNSALTLSNLKTIFGTNPLRQPSFFEHPWYLEEEFIQTPANPGWHAVLMDVLPESLNQSSNYIHSLTQ